MAVETENWKCTVAEKGQLTQLAAARANIGRPMLRGLAAAKPCSPQIRLIGKIRCIDQWAGYGYTILITWVKSVRGVQSLAHKEKTVHMQLSSSRQLRMNSFSNLPSDW